MHWSGRIADNRCFRRHIPGDHGAHAHHGMMPDNERLSGAALMKGNVEGRLIVRNCIFANGLYFDLQMTNLGGNWEIYNNVFIEDRKSVV